MSLVQPRFLLLHETGTNLNDIVPRALVYHRIILLQVVENIHCERPVSSANFIDDEVLIREVLEEVLGYQALRDGLCVVRLD